MIRAAVDGMMRRAQRYRLHCDTKDCGKCKPGVVIYLRPIPDTVTIPPPSKTCEQEPEYILTILPVDSINGEPIPDAEITITVNGEIVADSVGLSNSSFKTTINENGEYMIEGVADGYKPGSVSTQQMLNVDWI